MSMIVTRPTLEEARTDLANIRDELNAMMLCLENARFLATRDDVDAAFYKTVVFKVERHIASGTQLECKILNLYPDLH